MKVIVISAVNLRSGGPLSVLEDCLRLLDRKCAGRYRVVAIVHAISLFKGYENIEFVEYNRSASSYLYRIYLEYFYFNRLSKKLNPYLWFSLHDITPSVCAERRAVYCHNAMPFYKLSLKEVVLQPSLVLFNYVYRYFYLKNIRLNDFVVVQQDWLREEFVKGFGVEDKSVIVSYPTLDSLPGSGSTQLCGGSESGKMIFVFPAFPRVFKNIEVLCEAAEILLKKNVTDFEVWLTLDGSENRYSKYLVKRFGFLDNIKFKGVQSRTEVFAWYQKADALVFPSKLETWGLPISEFKVTGKPMLVVDLPYAHETVGDYERVAFFEKDDSALLADKMHELMSGLFNPEGNTVNAPEEPFVVGWEKLFKYMLN